MEYVLDMIKAVDTFFHGLWDLFHIDSPFLSLSAIAALLYSAVKLLKRR